MPSHPESIARRMVSRLAPSRDGEAPSSPTDETTDESATGDGALPGGQELVLGFAAVIAAVAALSWTIYSGLDPSILARRHTAQQKGDMPALQRETARLKQILLTRLQTEAVTPADLPENGRSRILDAAAEETLAESA